jgi:hypothetical protein
MPSKQRPLLKQFAELTNEDFEKYPVWVNCHVIDYDEPWYDDTDEATFRPWTGDLPVDPHETTFLVAANLSLADGTMKPGFVTPQIEEEPFDLGSIQPHLFAPDGSMIAFWFGVQKATTKDKASTYKVLGKKPDEVFPLKFAAKPGLATGTASGTIEGFSYFATVRGREVRTEK